MDCLACQTANTESARFCAKCGAPLPLPKGAEADPLIGVTVGGRYRITRVIGEGGMGRVYEGEQQMGTRVRKAAVKTLLSQFAKDAQTVGRFMREVGTVSELEHPNTIKVYDFGQIEGTGELYIAMELLQGKALDEALASGQPISPERVDRIIGQVCGSLQEAHEKGIVHRDLKPANIFLTTRAGEEDVVKVLDFGIAKRDAKDTQSEQKLTQQGMILGTPPYMSPEQFTGKELDARSDLYALGVVTYEMLTGRLPLEADTPWQWMTQHMNAQPFPFETIPSAANVPQKMRQAVMRALSKDAAQRPQTAREFFEDLTLGATRMSAVGLGSAGVGGISTFSHRGSGHISEPNISGPVAGSGRVAGTQVGAPLIPDQFPGSEFPTAPGSLNPAGGTAPGGSMPPGLDPNAYGGRPAVPTSGGQVYPMPPARAQKGGAGTVIGILASLCVAGGLVGGFFYWRSTQDATATNETDDEDGTIPVKTSSSATESAVVASTSPQPSSTTAPSHTATSAATTQTVATSATQTVAAGTPGSPVAGHSNLPTLDEWNAQSLVTVANAKKLGCEARTVREWVRVMCTGANDTGGTPFDVVVDRGNQKGDAFVTSKDKVTTLIYPFQSGTDLEARFSWTDKSASYKSLWPAGSPKPPAVGAFDAPSPPPIAQNPTSTPPRPLPTLPPILTFPPRPDPTTGPPTRPTTRPDPSTRPTVRPDPSTRPTVRPDPSMRPGTRPRPSSGSVRPPTRRPK